MKIDLTIQYHFSINRKCSAEVLHQTGWQKFGKFEKLTSARDRARTLLTALNYTCSLTRDNFFETEVGEPTFEKMNFA